MSVVDSQCETSRLMAIAIVDLRMFFTLRPQKKDAGAHPRVGRNASGQIMAHN